MKKQGLNPYLPSWEYIPDGEPYVFNGRVYVYGSHDRFNGHAYCLNDYVCWSAPVDDLADWRYEGVIYKKTDDPLNPDGSMCLYAPDVTVGPDGDIISIMCLIRFRCIRSCLRYSGRQVRIPWLRQVCRWNALGRKRRR